MGKLRQLLVRLAYGIRHPEEEVTRAQRLVADSYFFVRYCAARLRRHRAPQLASALSYRTIFSIIPLLALSLVMVRGIYGEEGIRHGMRAVMEFTGISEIAIVTGEVDSETIDPTEDDDEEPGGSGNEVGVGTGSALGTVVQSGEDGQPIVHWPVVSRAKPMAVFVWATPNFQQRMAGSGNGRGGALGGAADASARNAERSEAVSDWIERFVDNMVGRLSGINLRWITLVAVGVFIYAAISLLIQIEDAFNAVCNARSGRAIVTRVTTYWTMLTLGSLALVASFVVGEAYSRILSQLPSWLEFIRPSVSVATKLGVSWLLLLFAYTQMPNTRVKLRGAAIGAFVAAALWEAGKGGLGRFIGEMTGGQVAVYGSLALLPLFLLWVYVTWLIVLFGLELAHSIQTVGPERREQLLRRADVPVLDPLVGIAALRAVALRFDDGATSSPSDVAEALGVPEHTAQRIIRRLIDGGILLQAVKGAELEGLSLAMPAERIRLRDVAERVFPLSLASEARDGVESIRESQLRAFGGLSLADVLRDDPLGARPHEQRGAGEPGNEGAAETSAGADGASEGVSDDEADDGVKGVRSGRSVRSES